MDNNFNIKGFNIDKTTSFMRRLSNSISIEYNEQEKNKDGFFREAEIVKYAFTKTQGRCIYCGKKLYVTNEKDTYQLISGSSLDHLIPASCLGLCVKGNIALACKDCNEKRGNVSPEIFFNYLHLHRKPTLYDTIDEFKKALNDFQKPYVDKFSQLYKFGKILMDQKPVNASFNLTYNNNGIDEELTVPIDLENPNVNHNPFKKASKLSKSDIELVKDISSSNTNSKYQVKMITKINNLFSNLNLKMMGINLVPETDEFNPLVKHINNVSGIRRSKQIKKFKRTVNCLFYVFEKIGITKIDELSKLNNSVFALIVKDLCKDKVFSRARTQLVILYIKLALSMELSKDEAGRVRGLKYSNNVSAYKFK